MRKIHLEIATSALAYISIGTVSLLIAALLLVSPLFAIWLLIALVSWGSNWFNFIPFGAALAFGLIIFSSIKLLYFLQSAPKISQLFGAVVVAVSAVFFHSIASGAHFFIHEIRAQICDQGFASSACPNPKFSVIAFAASVAVGTAFFVRLIIRKNS